MTSYPPSTLDPERLPVKEPFKETEICASCGEETHWKGGQLCPWDPDWKNWMCWPCLGAARASREYDQSTEESL